MIDFITVALSILAITLLVFGLGAISGWAWGTKSLVPRPPYWITGVLAGAGLCYIAAQLLQSEWLGAASAALLFTILVGGNLRIGPFRPKSGNGQAT